MELEKQFQVEVQRPSDINEHLSKINEYASQCDTILELGAGRGSGSLCAIATGLLKRPVEKRRLYYCNPDNSDVGFVAQQCCTEGIPFKIYKENTYELKFDERVDMLMIDSWHVYQCIYLELTNLGKLTNRYIVMHDSFIDRDIGESTRVGSNIKELAKKTGWTRLSIERGVGPAIQKFVKENPEWKIKEELENNNGLTILERV
jgi:hypothetical protein